MYSFFLYNWYITYAFKHYELISASRTDIYSETILCTVNTRVCVGLTLDWHGTRAQTDWTQIRSVRSQALMLWDCWQREENIYLDKWCVFLLNHFNKLFSTTVFLLFWVKKRPHCLMELYTHTRDCCHNTHMHTNTHTHTHTHTFSDTLWHTHLYTLSDTHTHTHTLSLWHTHILRHSLTHTCTHSQTLFLAHTHTPPFRHSLSDTQTHTHTLSLWHTFSDTLWHTLVHSLSDTHTHSQTLSDTHLYTLSDTLSDTHTPF